MTGLLFALFSQSSWPCLRRQWIKSRFLVSPAASELSNFQGERSAVQRIRASASVVNRGSSKRESLQFLLLPPEKREAAHILEVPWLLGGLR